MKNLGFLLGLVLLLGLNCQCTEDESVDSYVYAAEMGEVGSGEEGDDRSDINKD